MAENIGQQIAQLGSTIAGGMRERSRIEQEAEKLRTQKQSKLEAGGPEGLMKSLWVRHSQELAAENPDQDKLDDLKRQVNIVSQAYKELEAFKKDVKDIHGEDPKHLTGFQNVKLDFMDFGDFKVKEPKSEVEVPGLLWGTNQEVNPKLEDEITKYREDITPHIRQRLEETHPGMDGTFYRGGIRKNLKNWEEKFRAKNTGEEFKPKTSYNLSFAKGYERGAKHQTPISRNTVRKKSTRTASEDKQIKDFMKKNKIRKRKEAIKILKDLGKIDG